MTLSHGGRFHCFWATLSPPALYFVQPISMTEQIINNIKDWSLSNGFVMLEPNGSLLRAMHAPVTLNPSKYPRSQFEKAYAIQKDFNQLYVNVTLDTDWLLGHVKELGLYDAEFSGRLLQIHEKTVDINQQPFTAGLFRSDYILDSSESNASIGGQIKQVEFNTVSVSFGALSTKVSQLHRFLRAEEGRKPVDNIPESSSLHELAEGLFAAHSAYKPATKAPIVLFVVQPGERNAMDQRLIEYELFNRHGIFSQRLTLTEITERLVIRPDADKAPRLYLGEKEISVVYLRSGYGPGDYPSEKEWDGRLLLETSYAVKCPSALTQLSGAKKIQQLLCNDSELERLLPNASQTILSDLKSTFVKIYPMDKSAEGIEARERALKTPEKFVLKPQREGGGNNIYKENIPDFLKNTPESQWPAYILMELINPAPASSDILRGGKVYSGEVVSELGIFGASVWNSSTGEVSFNKASGWLLRTKLESSNEGGVAAGFGCLDSIDLY